MFEAKLVAENEIEVKVTTSTEEQPKINQELVNEEDIDDKIDVDNDNTVKNETISSKLSQFQDLIFNIDGFDAIVISFAPLFLILILGLIFKTNIFASTQKDIDILSGKFVAYL